MVRLFFAAALLLASPAIAREPANGDGTPITIGTSYTLHSAALGTDRTINVWLPPNYEDDGNRERRFPVLYLIDGGVEQDFHHISGIAQHAAISGTMEPFIVVGIETENRMLELTSPSDEPRYPEWMRPNGGIEDFRAFIRSEVIPWVESRYRVTGRRAVIGESLAGLFVADTFLRAPDLFTDYISVSPSLWWDNGWLIDNADAFLAAHPFEDRRLYITMANEGGPQQRRLDEWLDLLEQQAPDGLEWLYVDRTATEHHGSIFHTAALDALRVLFGTPARLGSPVEAWWVFEGEPPPLTPEAEADIASGECTAERASPGSIPAYNADRVRWNGICITFPLGPRLPMRGNLIPLINDG